MSAIDIDAVYAGDKEAIGDAIRLLTRAISNTPGVLPVLTDKIIIPTFAEDGLIIESEDGQRLAEIGAAAGSASWLPGENNWLTANNFQNRLRLGDVFNYTTVPVADTTFLTNAAGTIDTSLVGVDILGVNRILYRVTPSANRTVHGMHSAVDYTIEGGNVSQVVVVWNDSAFAITFGTGVVTNDRKFLNTPFAIGPQGSVVFVFDAVDEGWRPIAINGGQWFSYATSWTGASSNPAIGNGGIAMQCRFTGYDLEFRLNVGMGSTTTYGSGVWSFSLPATVVAVGTAGSARALDNGTNLRTGASEANSTTTVSAIFDSSANYISATVPFTWADGDALRMGGSVRIG